MVQSVSVSVHSVSMHSVSMHSVSVYAFCVGVCAFCVGAFCVCAAPAGSSGLAGRFAGRGGGGGDDDEGAYRCKPCNRGFKSQHALSVHIATASAHKVLRPSLPSLLCLLCPLCLLFDSTMVGLSLRVVIHCSGVPLMDHGPLAFILSLVLWCLLGKAGQEFDGDGYVCACTWLCECM